MPPGLPYPVFLILIQGVTFMAFGNGAPDIFSSLASVLSTSQPKAGLAIGALVGEKAEIRIGITN